SRCSLVPIGRHHALRQPNPRRRPSWWRASVPRLLRRVPPLCKLAGDEGYREQNYERKEANGAWIVDVVFSRSQGGGERLASQTLPKGKKLGSPATEKAV
ncbi:MAG TPA: hypothetical protein VI009_07170, partial [Xanthobacteraceae bacterium]